MSSGYFLLDRNYVTLYYIKTKIISILRIITSWSCVLCTLKISKDIYNREFSIISCSRVLSLFLGSLVQKDILFHFWYLWPLIMIYLLLPLLLRNKDKLEYIWIVLLVLGIVLQSISYYIGTPIQKNIIQSLRLWTWIQYFILGFLLRKWGNANKWNTRINGSWLVAISIFAVTYQEFMSHYINNRYAEFFYDSIVEIILVTVIFCFILKLNLTFRQASTIRIVAGYTLGIYVLHPLIIQAVNKFYIVNNLWTSVILFFMVLSLSSMSSMIIEKLPFFQKLIEL